MATGRGPLPGGPRHFWEVLARCTSISVGVYISGRAELVTGPTAGIGEATAQALADAGADVVVNGRDADRVAQAVERLGARGGAADVGTAGGVAELVRQVPDVDVLVNNTGVFGPRPVFEILHGE